MYKYNRKKEIIKNVVLITFILALAIISTRYIYYEFSDTTEIDFSSESLDITFHDEKGEQLDITKVTPLTDAVGLATQGHSFTITNNLTEPVDYKIQIIDNELKMTEQNCEGITIPREEIRVSIKQPGETTKIYKLSDLTDGTILTTAVKALDESKYTIRVWVNNDCSLPSGSENHYHGLIQVVESNTIVAVK